MASTQPDNSQALSGLLEFLSQLVTPELVDLAKVVGPVVAGIGILLRLYPHVREWWIQRLLARKLPDGSFNRESIKNAMRYFIRPRCSNIDPAQEVETRHALSAVQEDLFQRVDRFVHQEEAGRRHLLVLADSGMGKTTFLLNYFAYNEGKWRQKAPIVLVPLGRKNADQLIEQVEEKANKVICLDAFDEDVQAIEDHRGRIADLMELCADYRRVIITCRTQFFLKEEEIPVDTGIVRVEDRRAGEPSVYEFWKLYLSPFSDDDVAQFIKKRYPFWRYRLRKQARDAVQKIPLLRNRG